MERVLYLTASNGGVFETCPAKVSEVKIDILGRTSAAKRLVRGNRIVTAGCKSKSDFDVRRQSGSNLCPRLDTTAVPATVLAIGSVGNGFRSNRIVYIIVLIAVPEIALDTDTLGPGQAVQPRRVGVNLLRPGLRNRCRLFAFELIDTLQRLLEHLFNFCELFIAYGRICDCNWCCQNYQQPCEGCKLLHLILSNKTGGPSARLPRHLGSV